MIRMRGKRRAFTLMELMVVIAMIAIIMGALTVALSKAQERARVQKATMEVKVISQSITAYQEWSKSDLPTLKDEDASASSLSFLFGKGSGTRSGQQLPSLLMAQMNNGGKILDPWGQPYKVRIYKGTAGGSAQYNQVNSGYYLPNFHRLDDTERKVIW